MAGRTRARSRAPKGEAPAPARPAIVRIKKGEQPTHSPLTPFQRLAWRLFKGRVTTRPPDPTLDEMLLKAHIRLRGDEYLAYTYLATICGAGGLLVAGVAVAVVLTAGLGLSVVVGIVVGALIAVLAPIGLFFALKGAPGSKAKSRARDIDARISAAMSFVSAMASADVNIDQILLELGKQKIYGQVAEEAAWITRDTELLGVDILTAIRNGAVRTPSKRFQDFLQGVVTTATSGGQLKPYFLLKAEQFETEHKLEMLQRVETMGLLAETFVTVVVAFPLFLVIIIAIFAIIGGGGTFMLDILYAIVGLMIPLSQLGFIFFMYQLAQEM